MVGFVRFVGILLFLFIAVVCVYFNPFFKKKTLHIGGFVKSGNERILKVFKENFENGLESEGASFAVYYDGNLVVDLWGGYADRDAARLWSRDTMTISFSSTKGVAALCVAMLVDRGLIDYNQEVSHYWPEFARNHKGNITVQMLVSHQGGIAYIDHPISFQEATNWKALSKILEDQSPNWQVGTSTGYHVITHGWLIDQLIRRTDKQHRSLSQFFDEEIRQKFDVDFYIGLPKELNYKTARLKLISFQQQLVNIFDHVMIKYKMKTYLEPSQIQDKAWMNPSFLFEHGFSVLNDPDVRALQLGSTNGFGTARSLAQIFNLFADGQLIHNQSIVTMLSNPLVKMQEDLVLRLPTTGGFGLSHTRRRDDSWVVGHAGYGGQGVKVDIKKRLSYAYLTNSLTTELGSLSKTWRALEKAVFETFY